MEYTYLNFMACMSELDAVDWTLRCVCVQWSINGKADHTVQEWHGKRRTEILQVGEWCVVELFSKIECTVHLESSADGIDCYTSGLLLPKHSF